MIKEAGTNGFVLSLYKQELAGQTSPWGVHVKIVDFETLPDGLLGVTIEATSLVSITNLTTDKDELRHADTIEFEHWPEQVANDTTDMIASLLQLLMKENSQYSELYHSTNIQSEPQWASPTWVARRWLEILPISYQYREKFVQSDTFNAAQNYIQTMVLGLKNSSTIKV